MSGLLNKIYTGDAPHPWHLEHLRLLLEELHGGTRFYRTEVCSREFVLVLFMNGEGYDVLLLTRAVLSMFLALVYTICATNIPSGANKGNLNPDMVSESTHASDKINCPS